MTVGENPASPPSKLPAFETILKSRDVEDPVNLWVHRPLAYAFVALIYRTPMTPNQVTLLAMTVGVAAGVAFLIGTPQAMVLGGILLWTSAILDGADGILARAKRLFSDVGRAIDGVADAVVAASSVLLGFYHVWAQHHSLFELALMPLALGTSLVHVYSFDFYKEAYLQHTNPNWNGQPERVADVKARGEALREQGGPWYARTSVALHAGLVQAQNDVVQRLNPLAIRQHLIFPVNEQSVEIYRRYNRGPMRLWALVSTAPHSYMMSICAMFDRLDVYLFIRVFAVNAIFLWACVWQRIATRRTVEALAGASLSPRLADAGYGSLANAR